VTDRRAAAALALVTALLLAGCVEPAHGSADYAAKAAMTAKTAADDVQTARLAARLGGEDRAFDPYLDTVISNAEDDLAAATQAFDTVQPPAPADDELRRRLDAVLQEAADGVAALRIAVRRHGGGALPEVARPLARVAAELQQLGEPAS
jgi:hypothetical protein